LLHRVLFSALLLRYGALALQAGRTALRGTNAGRLPPLSCISSGMDPAVTKKTQCFLNKQQEIRKALSNDLNMTRKEYRLRQA